MPLVSIASLVRRFQNSVEQSDDRAAAELAFVLAERLRREGLLQDARKYAAVCLDMTSRLPSHSLDDVSVDELSIGGIPLPERFHAGVVRARLEGLLDP
jgi:hypothetical protein